MTVKYKNRIAQVSYHKNWKDNPFFVDIKADVLLKNKYCLSHPSINATITALHGEFHYQRMPDEFWNVEDWSIVNDNIFPVPSELWEEAKEKAIQELKFYKKLHFASKEWEKDVYDLE